MLFLVDFIFVSLEEKGYHGIVSVERSSFDWRSSVGAVTVCKAIGSEMFQYWRFWKKNLLTAVSFPSITLFYIPLESSLSCSSRASQYSSVTTGTRKFISCHQTCLYFITLIIVSVITNTEGGTVPQGLILLAQATMYIFFNFSLL